jgi:hypothetical protein
MPNHLGSPPKPLIEKPGRAYALPGTILRTSLLTVLLNYGWNTLYTLL